MKIAPRFAQLVTVTHAPSAHLKTATTTHYPRSDCGIDFRTSKHQQWESCARPRLALLLGEERAKMRDSDEVLTPDQLAELQRRLSMLHPSSVEQVYREAHERCAPVTGRVPKASVIQELVTAWRVLRKWGNR